MRGHVVALAVALAMWTPLLGAEAAEKGPQPKTIEAWNAYVAATESRIEFELGATGPFLASELRDDRGVARDAILKGDIPVGPLATVDRDARMLSVPGATIAHWCGAVLLPGISLDALLHRVQHPDENGPYPDDVLSLRVLTRAPDRLTLAMRLTRTKIVTATYDTEHLATYRRLGPTRASSRSVSTKIAEVADAGTSDERVLVEGQDRGFLWRMNSCWRYEEVPGGVIVELESITLSRGIPMGLGVVLEPMINRIARESVTRTLASVRRLYRQLAWFAPHARNDRVMVPLTRWMRFNLVGVAGFVVQMLTLAAVTRWLGVGTSVAVIVAVLVAVSHNFLWHERVTWPGQLPGGRLWRWLSFNLSNGLISVVTNVVVTTLVVAVTGTPLLVANALAVAMASVANFLVSDRYVFSRRT